VPNNPKTIAFCRICNSKNLEILLEFGNMALTGVFLTDGKQVSREPLTLGRCNDCSLVQLMHSYNSNELYGESYGYESHLNASMVNHLQRKARVLEKKYLQTRFGTIVDIASNDGTLLAGYSNSERLLIGIDPLISVVSDHYPKKSLKIQEFFSADKYFENTHEKASLVTSLSVLYDLESPTRFAQDISEILEDEGIWHFEQSYLCTMVETLSYDTVCHEHLLYLSLHNIVALLQQTGLKILDVTLNSTNGGSIAVTAIKTNVELPLPPFASHLLEKEKREGFISGERLRIFATDAVEHKNELLSLVTEYKSKGFKIVGLGASTKGNVLLQWLDLNTDSIDLIGDINPRKYGKSTPGTNIPIVSEAQVFENTDMNTIILVLPWHFRDGIIRNSELVLSMGASLLFPLPRIELIN
jgi:hypothetical protein